MKIRSLLLIAFLGGQAMPAVAMERGLFNKVVHATSNYVEGVISLVKKHPYLMAGIYLGGMASLYAVDKASRYFDIGHKMKCHTGINSPDDHLFRAVLTDDLKDAQWALNRGANPNINTTNGYQSPLRIAIYRSNEPMIDLLIEYGADVNAEIYLGVALTAEPFNREVAKKLIMAGADQNAIIMGMTAIEFAQAHAARTGNQNYITIFKPENKL